MPTPEDRGPARSSQSLRQWSPPVGGDSLPRGPPHLSTLLMLNEEPSITVAEEFSLKGKNNEIQLLQLMHAGFYFPSTPTRSLRPTPKTAFSTQDQLQSPCKFREALAPGNGQGGCASSSCHSQPNTSNSGERLAKFPRVDRSSGIENFREVEKPAP